MKSQLRFLFIFLLIVGVFFRFTHLDRKVYWIDETYTSLRISGYTETEVAQQISQGQVLSIADLHNYQRINSEKTVINTINGLATEEPQLTPLYFILVRFWVQLFGSSIAVVRSFSALISLLAFPCLYWLCRELFKSSLVGWVAMILIAASPFHLVYAQEARPYSLWILMTLLASASLLRAMRVNTKISWSLYAATVALGLYSHLFFLFVVIAHGIYSVILKFSQNSQTLKAYLIASSSGLIAFVPWLLIIFINLGQIYTMTPGQSQDSRMSLLSFIRNWLGNITRVFIDFGLSSESPSIYLMALLPIILIIASIVGYSLYYLYRNTPKSIWLFIFTLMGVNSGCLVLPDLLIGGQRSVLSRYFIPFILGAELAVAYLLTSKLTTNSVHLRQKQLWTIIVLLLISGGVLSCNLNSQAQVWWNQRPNSHNPKVARIINQASHPLVIGEVLNSPPRFNILNIISLSYLLDPNVRFQFIKEKTEAEIAKGFSHVFLFSPSDELRAAVESKYRSRGKLVYQDSRHKLWLL
jgi:uncharacterized membrane protein